MKRQNTDLKMPITVLAAIGAVAVVLTAGTALADSFEVRVGGKELKTETNAFYTAFASVGVTVDATQTREKLPNSSQVLTFWNGVMKNDRSLFEWPTPEKESKRESVFGDYPIGFVRYAELMACSGGNNSRDLFKNPADRNVLDDYDFAPLVAACRGILRLGMKPYLKLGNVPAKFSSDYDGGEFSMNIRPPTDDLVHYRYMKACAAALKAAFGKNEVRSWRFAVLTEADNVGWFQVKSKSREELREAFFRLYDYAARAFEEELGGDLVFGTHLLYPGDNFAQSQFSVEEFVEHCASGANAATGKKGAPLRLLTASYYGWPGTDNLIQGRCTNLRRIRAALDKAGFRNVVTGVDEGRVIASTPGRERNDLQSRAVGASYQAAFDIRVVKEIFDCRMDYFASWAYFTGPDIHFEGVPSHHYFSSRELAKFEGFRRASASVSGVMPPKEELDAIAGVSPDGRTVRAVIGRFRDKLVFTNHLETTVMFRLPKDWAGKRVRASVLTLDDRNNWFVDWERDRVELGVTTKDYLWSWDDFAVLGFKNLQGEKYCKAFAEKLQPRYARKAATVRPMENELTVSDDATHTLPLVFIGNGSAFITLRAVEPPEVQVGGKELKTEWRPKTRLCGFNLLGMFCRTKMEKGDKRISGYFPEDRFRWMHDWGFNFARLPLDYRFFVQDGDWMKLDEAQLKKLDAAVAYGRKYGIHVNIDFHRAPGYCCNVPMEPKSLFTDPEPLAAFTNLWATLAKRYRSIPNDELTFDLVNEPADVAGYGATPSNYAVVARAAIAAIRAIDPDRFIMSDGWRWGIDPCLELRPLPHNVGESIHTYAPHNLSHHGVAWMNLDKRECPPWPPAGYKSGREWFLKEYFKNWESVEKFGDFLHMGEFGTYFKCPHATALRWTEDLLAIAKEKNLGWAMWNLDGAFGLLDSGRTDCEFEDFEVHKLDRRMLELLIKYK